MGILNIGGRAAGFACSKDDIGNDRTCEYEECLKSVTPEDQLRTVKRQLATALFHNRNLRLDVNGLAQTLGSLLRDLTQQENSLQTALRAVSRAMKNAEERSENE